MLKKILNFILLILSALFIITNASFATGFIYDHINPDLTEWETIDEGSNYAPSMWGVSDNIITQTSNIFGGKTNRNPEKPGTFAISGNPDWHDYIYKVKFNSVDDDGIGIVFNYIDKDNYYRFSMDKQRKFRRLIKKVNGVVSVLAEDRYSFNKNEWYALKVSNINTKIKINLNGEPIFKVKDSSLKFGRIGLYCWGNDGSLFKDIAVALVKKIEAEPQKTVVAANIEPVIQPSLPPDPLSPETDINFVPVDFTPLLTEIKMLRKEINSLREEVEIRRKLQITEEERSKEEEEILSATGREYTLLNAGTIGMEYSFNYSYYSYSSDLKDKAESDDFLIRKYFGNHVLDHSLYIEYAHRDNLTLNINLPFTSRYEKEETNNSKSVSDIGDIGFGFQFQPIKVGGKNPAVTISSNLSCPTGRSPYEINTETDISTGNGYYAVSTGVALSKSIDPLIAFGGLSYSYNFSETSVDTNHFYPLKLKKISPGDTVTLSLGFATALSYNVSLNMSFQYSYQMESMYYFDNLGDPTTETSPSVSSVFSIGTGWRYSTKRTINSRISIGLTDNDPNLTFSIMLPFELNLN